MKSIWQIWSFALLVISLTSCSQQVKEDNSSKEPPTIGLANTDIDSLFSEEWKIELVEGQLSNVDLVNGYHSIRLGIKIDNIIFNNHWHYKTLCDSIITYTNNDGKSLTFLNNRLESIEVTSPLYPEIKTKLSVFEILRLKFGEPNLSDFSRVTEYNCDGDAAEVDRLLVEDIYRKTVDKKAVDNTINNGAGTLLSLSGQGYLQKAIWKGRNTTLIYTFNKEIYHYILKGYDQNHIDSITYSKLLIQDNNFDGAYKRICAQFKQDNLSQEAKREKAERNKILHSN